MMSEKQKQFVEHLLDLADVQINGSNPWDIQIQNKEFYKRVIKDGELGLGESYMDGWWSVEKLDELIYRIIQARLDEKIQRNLPLLFNLFIARTFNQQSKQKAFNIAEKHYDLGNELFQIMLDKRMNYSCAYWKNGNNLDEAQENKLDLICRKLYLKPGQRVLDIGCGWGAFGKYAAEKYDVEVVGITVSKEQIALGKKLCDGLPVEFRLIDYRDINEKFDRIVSVGMIEHVGHKNYRTFFKVANKCLKNEGLFLLHSIGRNSSSYSLSPWTDKYIFPNGTLPSIDQIALGIRKLFVMEDWHNFGTDYDKTLLAWYDNFAENWDKIKDQYSERFFKMWQFYLLSAPASFRARRNQLWQIVLSKNGNSEGYQSIR